MKFSGPRATPFSLHGSPKASFAASAVAVLDEVPEAVSLRHAETVSS